MLATVGEVMESFRQLLASTDKTHEVNTTDISYNIDCCPRYIHICYDKICLSIFHDILQYHHLPPAFDQNSTLIPHGKH